MSPEEREFEREEAYGRDIDQLEIDEQLADEARDESLIEQAQSIMDRWPTRIDVYPVELDREIWQ